MYLDELWQVTNIDENNQIWDMPTIILLETQA